MLDHRRHDEEINEIINNFKIFFGNLPQEFEVKDAYKIYLDIAKSTDDFEEAISFFEQALIESKKIMPEDSLEKFKDRLCSDENSKPYMTVRKELGDLYTSVGLFDNAIEDYYEVIELDYDDKQGIRFKLVNLLILQERYGEAEYLIDIYSDDESSLMLYPTALYYFSQEDYINGQRYINRAFDSNCHLPKYLFGIKIVEEPVTTIYDVGEENEAMLCFDYCAGAWISVKDSLYWLIDEYFRYVRNNDLDVEFSEEEANASVKIIISDGTKDIIN